MKLSEISLSEVVEGPEKYLLKLQWDETLEFEEPDMITEKLDIYLRKLFNFHNCWQYLESKGTLTEAILAVNNRFGEDSVSAKDHLDSEDKEPYKFLALKNANGSLLYSIESPYKEIQYDAEPIFESELSNIKKDEEWRKLNLKSYLEEEKKQSEQVFISPFDFNQNIIINNQMNTS